MSKNSGSKARRSASRGSSSGSAGGGAFPPFPPCAATEISSFDDALSMDLLDLSEDIFGDGPFDLGSDGPGGNAAFHRADGAQGASPAAEEEGAVDEGGGKGGGGKGGGGEGGGGEGGGGEGGSKGSCQ